VFETTSHTVGKSNPLIEANMMELDLNDEDVRKWTYGYGFSYVHRRQAVLDYPYDNINLGEDYRFFSTLLQKNGNECITLVEDRLGICLHTQHAANTAKDFALWEVPEESIADLDFADFFPVFNLYLAKFPRSQRVPDKDDEDSIYINPITRSEPRRFREVTAHMSNRTVKVRCTAGSTCAEFLQVLEHEIAASSSRPQVSRIPPAGSVSASQRDMWIDKVLSLVSPIAPPADQIRDSDYKTDNQEHEMLLRVTRPVQKMDRIGVRTTDLWICFPEDS